MFSNVVKLQDGRAIPQLGLGVLRTPLGQASRVVSYALRVGYRHIDTASIYRNEAAVGEGIRLSGVARAEVYLTTKLWNTDQGFDKTLRAFDASLNRLEMQLVDLYLIHWPDPVQDRFVATWRALIRLRDEGRIRSIGVSNFEPEHLERLFAETGVSPALNQIELHPRFQQRALRQVHAQMGIATQAWSPLGQGTLLAEPAVIAIARRHGRTPAQIIIRWHLQAGTIVIPKSVTPARILQNGSVDDFSLDTEDVGAIDALDRNDGRIGPNPMTATF